VSNPNPIPVVATGKLGDLAIKSGKPIEAKITLYRGNAAWTIDDLLELQETALLTIVLQPQMVQRPMPMKEEAEKKSPTFTIDGRDFPVLPNTADGYVLLGEELLALVEDAEDVWQLVNEGWDDAADDIKWRPVPIAPGARILISHGDRFVTTLEEPAPVFYIDESPIALTLDDNGVEEMTGEHLLSLAFGGPLWLVELYDGAESLVPVEPAQTYVIRPDIRFTTTGPEAPCFYIDDKPFPIEAHAHADSQLEGSNIAFLGGAERIWKLVPHEPESPDMHIPSYSVVAVEPDETLVINPGDRFTTQNLDGDGSSTGPSAEVANEEPVAGARRRGR
jgi:hypothetical protein